MSTIDRAAEVIYDTLNGRYGDFLFPTDAAQALADAGLLAPDLPEPNFLTEYETEWDTLNGYVNESDGLITISHDERTEDDTTEQRERLDTDPGEIIITNPAEAEYLGHLIIAAANAAEEGGGGMSADFIKTMNSAWARGRVQQADIDVFREAGASVPDYFYGVAGLDRLTMGRLLDYWETAATSGVDDQ